MTQRARPQIDETLSCACGKVRIAVAGTVRAMLMCACEDCQRATGSGHAALAILNAADVTITGRVRAFARPAASGARLTRSFCPHCGTPLCGRSSRMPGRLLLPVGLFAGRSDWFAPTQLIFARSHMQWDVMPAGLPMHATYRQSGTF